MANSPGLWYFVLPPLYWFLSCIKRHRGKCQRISFRDLVIEMFRSVSWKNIGLELVSRESILSSLLHPLLPSNPLSSFLRSSTNQNKDWQRGRERKGINFWCNVKQQTEHETCWMRWCLNFVDIKLRTKIISIISFKLCLNKNLRKGGSGLQVGVKIVILQGAEHAVNTSWLAFHSSYLLCFLPSTAWQHLDTNVARNRTSSSCHGIKLCSPPFSLLLTKCYLLFHKVTIMSLHPIRCPFISIWCLSPHCNHRSAY